LKFGKELAVAAPMTAKAAKDTAIAGTRLEATCCAASGCLSPCVFLSGVSATCVPYVSAQSQDFPHCRSAKQSKSHRVNDRDDSRATAPKSSLKHGLIWLMIGYSRRPGARRPGIGRAR
jgi:hypothetical protein